jgi:hypothetical protein
MSQESSMWDEAKYFAAMVYAGLWRVTVFLVAMAVALVGSGGIFWVTQQYPIVAAICLWMMGLAAVGALTIVLAFVGMCATAKKEDFYE